MAEASCPCCNTEMDLHGDVVSGHMHYCGFCYGIMASDRWLSSNMRQPVLRNVRNGVFEAGTSAGYRCPTCDGEMVKGPVLTSEGTTIELDGCLKCGSLWFDNREMEPFMPEIRELTQKTDVSRDSQKLSSPTALARGLISEVFGVIASFTANKNDHIEDE